MCQRHGITEGCHVWKLAHVPLEMILAHGITEDTRSWHRGSGSVSSSESACHILFFLFYSFAFLILIILFFRTIAEWDVCSSIIWNHRFWIARYLLLAVAHWNKISWADYSSMASTRAITVCTGRSTTRWRFRTFFFFFCERIFFH